MNKLDPRVEFAAQRTLMAWIRTGLAMMGFGFVVARFSLFLKEMASTGQNRALETPGLSLWIGISLIAIGAAVSFLAGRRYAIQIEILRRGEPLPTHLWPMERITSLMLAVIGILMAGYLISIHL